MGILTVFICFLWRAYPFLKLPKDLNLWPVPETSEAGNLLLGRRILRPPPKDPKPCQITRTGSMSHVVLWVYQFTPQVKHNGSDYMTARYGKEMVFPLQGFPPCARGVLWYPMLCGLTGWRKKVGPQGSQWNIGRSLQDLSAGVWARNRARRVATAEFCVRCWVSLAMCFFPPDVLTKLSFCLSITLCSKKGNAMLTIVDPTHRSELI